MGEKPGITITVPFGSLPDWRFGTEPEEYSARLAERFVRTLVEEIKGRSKNYKKAVFGTVYFGGCGPSCLTLEELYQILQAVYDYLRVEPEEQTMVVVPDTVDFARAKVLRESGFDQMTLRVASSFRQEVIKNEMVVLREAGFFSVGLEFTGAVAAETIESFLPLAPDHIIFSSPDTGQDSIRRKLADGYIEYLPGHFAHPGKENRHLLALADAVLVAGFGPGAFSRDGGRVRKNPNRLAEYLKSIKT